MRGALLRIGADITTVDPVRTITRVGDRPVLLIHGSADVVDRPSESAERNLHAALAAGVPIGLEICQGAEHGKVDDTCPEAWARWAVSFIPWPPCGPGGPQAGERGRPLAFEPEEAQGRV